MNKVEQNKSNTIERPNKIVSSHTEYLLTVDRIKNMAMNRENTNQLSALIAEAVHNLDSGNTVTGQLWHWDGDWQEIGYLSAPKQAEWSAEINDRFLLTTALVSRFAGLDVDYDVNDIVQKRLSVNLEMCSPCLPDLPFYRDENFIKLLLQVNQAFPQTADSKGVVLTEYLAAWKDDMESQGKPISSDCDTRLISALGLYNQKIGQQVNDILITVSTNRGRQVNTPLDPEKAARIARFADPDRLNQYIKLLRADDALDFLIQSNYLSKSIYELPDSLSKTIDQVIITASASRFGLTDPTALCLYLQRQSVSCRIDEIDGEVARELAYKYFDKYLSYRFEYEVEDGLMRQRLDQIDPGSYLRLGTAHSHTPSAQEVQNIETQKATSIILQSQIQERSRHNSVKNFNLDSIDTLAAALQSSTTINPPEVVKALSIIRWAKGLSASDITAALESDMPLDQDLTGIASVLGVDINHVNGHDYKHDMLVAFKILTMLEPHITFQR